MGKEWDNINLKGSASRPNTSESARSRSTRGLNHGIHAGKPAFDLTPAANQKMQGWHFQWLKEAYRTLQPNGVIKAFSGTRTFHRLAASMKEAGFTDIHLEVWNYGSGFPKSLNIGRAIDKAARGFPQGGPDPDKRGIGEIPDRLALGMGGKDGTAVTGLTTEYREHSLTTPESKMWESWGTALKPGWEPVLVGRKPE